MAACPSRQEEQRRQPRRESPRPRPSAPTEPDCDEASCFRELETSKSVPHFMANLPLPKRSPRLSRGPVHGRSRACGEALKPDISWAAPRLLERRHGQGTFGRLGTSEEVEGEADVRLAQNLFKLDKEPDITIDQQVCATVQEPCGIAVCLANRMRQRERTRHRQLGRLPRVRRLHDLL